MALNIIKNYLTKNRCYQRNVQRKPIGMQLHTIGTGQGTAQSVAEYWNQDAVSACVTYCVDADVFGKVLQFLPESVRSWADAGYGNDNLITFEICESDYIKYTGGANYEILNMAKLKADIIRGYNTAVLLCADVCKRYGWNPKAKLPSGLYTISSHDEGRLAGLSSAHVDPTHIWKLFGLTMDGFRRDVYAAVHPKFQKGARYRMTTTMVVRTEPRADAPAVKFKDIPKNKRRYFKEGPNGEAMIKKGTVDRCYGEQPVGGRGTYMRVLRGYPLAEYKGKMRVVRV